MSALTQYFLILFLLLSSSVTTYSQAADALNCISKNLLSTDYSSAMYKVNVDVYDQHLSGIVVIKNEGSSDQHYQVVFLSEVGLTLVHFDYDRSKDKMELVSRAGFLDNKRLIAVLKADFTMLIRGLSCQKSLETKREKKRIREKGIRYLYDTNCSCIVSAKRWYGIFFSSELTATAYVHSVPMQLQIKHKGIKLSMQMDLIKYTP